MPFWKKKNSSQEGTRSNNSGQQQQQQYQQQYQQSTPARPVAPNTHNTGSVNFTYGGQPYYRPPGFYQADSYRLYD
ncbi:hypothetical protein IWW55_000236 [Coemansia sp. RSA 2706]|nr:hypothetical protein IWW55_000236 [Coemansia sp. RSA 2706]